MIFPKSQNKNSDKFDVVIIGAGPAGIFFAKELSRRFKVCVIEQNNKIKYNRFWLSYKQVVEKAGLKDYVISKTRIGNFRLFTGPNIKNNVPVWQLDSDKILKNWVKKNKAEMHFGEKYLGHQAEKTGIYIKTDKKYYFAKLLIDASGALTLDRFKIKNLVKKLYCYNYFSYLKSNNGIYQQSIVFGMLYPEKNKVFYEYFPINKNKALLEVCISSKKNISPNYLRQHFKKHVLGLQKMFEKKLITENEKFNVYGMFKVRKVVDNRIILVGDAAGWPNRSSGTGFNEIISHGPEVVRKISTLLRKDQLKALDLRRATEFRKEKAKNREIQDLIGYISRKMSYATYTKFFNILGKCGKNMLSNYMKLELTDNQIKKIVRLSFGQFNLREKFEILGIALKSKAYKGILYLIQIAF